MLTGRILVTGAKGFLGSHLVDLLCNDPVLRQRAQKGHIGGILTPFSRGPDLRDPIATLLYFYKHRPTTVFHLAARVGGIGLNSRKPGTLFYDNMMMGLNVLEAARQSGVARVIVVGTVCSYPKTPPAPFLEQRLWDGYPEETNAPYGIAKKALLVMGQAYRKEFGLDVVHLIPTNLYGPGDNFDSETSHVIPAMIRKLAHAVAMNQEEVGFWGTGEATREFLYVRDCARALMMAGEKEDGDWSTDPMNLGSGEEIRIDDLAERLAAIIGYKGTITFRPKDGPSGQPRRLVSSARATKLLGWRAAIPLEVGLQETVNWYKRTGGRR